MPVVCPSRTVNPTSVEDLIHISMHFVGGALSACQRSFKFKWTRSDLRHGSCSRLLQDMADGAVVGPELIVLPLECAFSFERKRHLRTVARNLWIQCSGTHGYMAPEVLLDNTSYGLAVSSSASCLFRLPIPLATKTDPLVFGLMWGPGGLVQLRLHDLRATRWCDPVLRQI